MAKYHIAGNEMRRYAVAAVVVLGTSVAAVTANERPGESLRVAAGIRVILPRDSETPLRLVPDADPSRDAAAQEGIPIGGFQPFVAITLTDKHKWGELVYEHVLADSFVGNSLNPPASSNYVIGLLDTGGRVSLVGYCDRAELGFTGSWLTGNQQLVGGVGGEAYADVGDTMGFFVAGLQAIDETTLTLDTTALTGHWHVSVIGLPEEVCGDEVDLPSAVGTPLLAFRDIVIRNDRIRTIHRNGVMYQGPEVEIYPIGDPQAPTYCNQIPLDVRPLGLTTAAYYANIFEFEFETPWLPTGLAAQEGAWPTGGWFVAGVSVQEGTSGEYMREFMVDTGAQISLIRTFLAGQLGLNVNDPDFWVDVAGVTGNVTQAPGFYLDTLKINAFTGTMVFHDVPVVALDIDVPGEGIVEGIVGTNVFHNRNLVFRPSLAGGSVLEVSAPLLLSDYYGDFDGDGDVDLTDFSAFQPCFNGPNRPWPGCDCEPIDSDGDGDIDLADFGRFQMCFNGPNRPPAADCPLLP